MEINMKDVILKITQNKPIAPSVFEMKLEGDTGDRKSVV